MQGSFSEEALQRFNAIVSELQDANYSESEDSYDFTRCVRPNGTAYGTGGKCKKGAEAAKPEQMAAPAPKRTKAERDTAAKATLQRMAAKGPETSVRKQGDRVVVSRGSEFKAVLHPEHQTALGKLKEGEKHEFEDEQGTWWKATRSGDNLNLEGGDRRSGNKPYKLNVKRSEITSVGTKKNTLKVKSSVSSQGGSYSVPGYSSSDMDVFHKGQHYTYTGKSGTIIKTGEPSKEFQTEGERRIYVSNSGKLYED
jgi:hypothetical protein